MPDPGADRRLSELRLLASYSFESRNEEDIRAEWIEPLLRLLGYGLGTRHRVIRELPLRLQPPTRMVASTRIDVDYIPTVFNRRLWIMEAKRPTDDLFSDAHLGQAWSYATDPRIDVPTMVLCDGQRFGIFDLTAVSWDEPRLDVRNPELPERFEEIVEIIGAAHIAETQRVRQLRHLRRALEAQLDLRALDRTLEDVRIMVEEVRPTVQERRNEIESEARRETATKGQAAIDAVGIWGHAQHFNGPPGAFGWGDIDHAVQLIRSTAPIVRAREFDQFEAATTPRGQSDTRMWFPLRVMRLAVAIQLIDDEACGERCRETAVQAAAHHASGFASDPLLAAAYRLQRALGPLGYRIAAGLGSVFDKQAQQLLETLEMEEWLRTNGMIGVTSDAAYDRVARLAPLAVVANLHPWTPESVSEHTVAAERLVHVLPTPSQYDHLQQAHDPWLNSWIDGDPVRHLTTAVLKELAARKEPASQSAFAESLLHDFFEQT